MLTYMASPSPDMVPYKTAYMKQYGLHLPLMHLLGNKIGIILANEKDTLFSGRVDISFWKFKESRPYAGRIHLSPQPGLDLQLIEDFAVGEMPQDYPKIGERTTDKKMVNLSLFYPSNEFWNFRIHYTWDGSIVDSEAEALVAEGRIYCQSMNNYSEDERADYNPPRKVVQLESGRWATKSN